MRSALNSFAKEALAKGDKMQLITLLPYNKPYHRSEIYLLFIVTLYL